MNNMPISGSDGDNNATTIVGGLVIALAIIAVALRFYTRISMKAGLRLDDWLVFLAVVLTMLMAFFVILVNAIDPDGERIADSEDPRLVYTLEDVFYLKFGFAEVVLYFTIVGSTKLSILLMYNRLFSVDCAFRHQLAVMVVIVLGFWIGCTVASLAHCIPFKWGWLNNRAGPHHCFSSNIFWAVAGTCEVFIDILILVLPVRLVLTLQLSVRKKAAVACVFLLGGFVVVTGLIKVILGYVPGSRVVSYSRSEVWTTVHAGMAIVCACLPILKPLLSRMSKSIWIVKMGKISEHRSLSWSKISRHTRRWNQNLNANKDEPRPEVELRKTEVPRQKVAFIGAAGRLALKEEKV